MGRTFTGEACALLAALTWALAVVLLKRTGEFVSPLALNLFKNVVALILLIATLAIMPSAGELMRNSTREDLAILVLSGMVGIAVGDTLLLRSLNLLGVGLASVVDCLYSPFVILFSYLILSEELGVSHYMGTGFILAGVFISSRHAPPADRTRGQLLLGIVLGAFSMAFMSFGIVIAKPVLDINDFPLIWATTLRLLPATIALALFAIASPQRREHWSVFRPTHIWKVSIPASVLGMYLAMIFWVAGFKYAKASIAGVLNQTSIIFAIILASLILKEPLTRRKLVAVAMASVGVVLVTYNIR
ncbi:MAG: DMT family transporter [Phycisphaerae bacterium]